MISPWHKEWPFRWKNLNLHHLRMLCAKLRWNWPSGSGQEDCKFHQCSFATSLLTPIGKGHGSSCWTISNPLHLRTTSLSRDAVASISKLGQNYLLLFLHKFFKDAIEIFTNFWFSNREGYVFMSKTWIPKIGDNLNSQKQLTSIDE